MQNSWNIETENTNKVKRTRAIISIVLAFTGLAVISSQVFPLLVSYIDGAITQKREEVKVEPVPESYKKYIEDEFAYYDPGVSYFANLSEQLGVLGVSTTYDSSTRTQKPINIAIDEILANPHKENVTIAIVFGDNVDIISERLVNATNSFNIILFL